MCGAVRSTADDVVQGCSVTSGESAQQNSLLVLVERSARRSPSSTGAGRVADMMATPTRCPMTPDPTEQTAFAGQHGQVAGTAVFAQLVEGATAR
jgi:hypothetical protein